MVEEARLEEVGAGLAPVTDGWFVVNARDAAWLTKDAFGARCVFEGERPVLRKRPDLPVYKFAEIGWTMHEVPGPERPLLALDEQQTLARDDEEVLLIGLCVV
jgi:hypothetical protein